MMRAFFLGLLGCATVAAQTIPPPGQLGSQPYSIRKTWIIGGQGNWDYLTVDPRANQLFISHGPVVQVVDVETGSVTGEVTGLHEAHQVALSDVGDVGYISDGPADEVQVFDRRTLKLVASIPTVSNPRALVYEPDNKLLFVISAGPKPEPTPPPSRSRTARPTPNPSPSQAPNAEARSSIMVIDAEALTPIATLLLPGTLGFATAGSGGQVYVNVVDRNQVVRLDATAVLSAIHDAAPHTPPAKPAPAASMAKPAAAAPDAGSGVMFDFAGGIAPRPPAGAVRTFSLGAECHEPRGLALDDNHQQLFAACNNMKMSVLNANSGQVVTSLPIGPAPDAIGYDAARGLIYTANGGAQGSVTIIRQDVTDTYAVIQTLPTRQRARTLAVNPSTGEVYLVTELMGVNLQKQGGIGSLKPVPATGSFQVLVVGNSGSM
jgi:DNA-binding beta-propeller fold protein YncE